MLLPDGLVLHRVEAVQNQVYEHLLKLDSVAKHLWVVSGQLHLQGDMPAHRVPSNEVDDILDRGVEVDRFHFHLALAEEVSNPFDGLARSLVGLSNIHDNFGNLIQGWIGSLEEEFALLGAPFADRGERGDASLRELRRILGRREVDGFIIDPHAAQPRMPIWIGGRTFRSLRRAVDLADGWAPFGLKADAIAAMIKRVSPLPAGFEVVLFPEPMPDPVGDPDGTRAVIAPYVDAGATILNLRLRSESLEQCLAQMEAMPTLVA